MKSYTTLRNLFGTLTNNNSSTNLTFGDQMINDSIRRVAAERDWDFMQKTATTTTTASTQFYNLPFDYDELIGVTVAVGSVTYTPKEAPTREFWDILNQVSFTSNFPEWYFIFNGQVGFYPTPSSTGNTITFIYDRRIIDLSMADYSTGTVDAVTNGSTTVTGSGTTWTTPMAGRWIRMSLSDTATAAGDHVWYEIASVTNTTTLVLSRNYNGTTRAAGAGITYVIGQMPVLPEPYQDLPVYEASHIYYSSVNPDPTKSTLFKNIFDEKHAQLIADHGKKSNSPVIEDIDFTIINPNLTITA